MKLEIEIPDEELRDFLAEKVRATIAARVNFWSTEATIKNMVQAKFDAHIEEIVVEEMGNSDPLREKIRVELERKIRLRLNAAIKAGAV